LNLFQFIKLVSKHLVLLIVVPLILAILVFFLTRNQPRIYESKTSIYTGIASGYSATNQENDRIDFFATNSEFDNVINIIKSRNTIEEVGMRLLVQHLSLDKADPKYISTDNYQALMGLVPADVKALIIAQNPERSLQNLKDYKNRNDTNFVYELINLYHRHYSYYAISGIFVRRQANSDILEISYQNDDPGICQQTLIMLTEVFINNHTQIKEYQADAVVKYFEQQLKLADSKLQIAEDKLLSFNKDNNIINYYEQTKYIASQKEELDLEYQREQMKLVGAEAVINEMESKLGSQQNIKLKSKEILSTRNALSNVSAKLALYETRLLNDSVSSEDLMKMSRLKMQVSELKMQLENAIDTLFMHKSTREGISSEKILEDWLKNVVVFEETKARLGILVKRKKEFQEVYKTFAPLGAILKRLEREIDVAERKYLSLLHSLALAKLKQQNIQLSNNVKLLDEPNYPITPRASKRKFLLIIAAMAGFFTVLFIILLLEYFDSNIKNIARAEKLIGLKVFAVFPRMSNISKKINAGFLESTALSMLNQELSRRIISTNKKENPFSVLIFSTRSAEGKTHVFSKLADKLRKEGTKILYVNYDSSSETWRQKGSHDITYKNNLQFLKSGKIENLLPEQVIINKDTEVVFLEIPSILHNQYPLKLIRDFDMAVLMVRANREWAEADRIALKNFRSIVEEPVILLNGMEPDQMEDIVGEIPRKRSRLRRMIKKIVTAKIYSKHRIK
jgi:polysaccharide biosynthesis transport protein